MIERDRPLHDATPPPSHLVFPADHAIRVIVLSTGNRPHFEAEAHRLFPVIKQFADVVGCDMSGTADMSNVDAELAIVLGGDGSILHAAHQMGDRQLPVVSINLGRLGFLAGITSDELPSILAMLRGGAGLAVSPHLMFACSLVRGGESSQSQLGLNEVTIRSGAPYHLLDINFYVDSELVTTYSGDGLIISTPVGSTAYSLSAGGPILRKELEAVVITPLNPHSLTNRPVVDSADRTYEMEVLEPHPDTAAVIDGRVAWQLQSGDRVRIRRAQQRFRMICPPGHSYYRTLQEKLGWGGQLRRKYGSPPES